jgi:hypothetical protein
MARQPPCVVRPQTRCAALCIAYDAPVWIRCTRCGERFCLPLGVHTAEAKAFLTTVGQRHRCPTQGRDDPLRTEGERWLQGYRAAPPMPFERVRDG